jgi:hypothetical protein
VVGLTWRTRAAILIAGVTLFRLAIAATTDLTDTEAYYAVWSRFPALSYYDHPPLLAWLVTVATAYSRSPLAERMVPVASSAVAAVLLYRLTARLFSARAGFYAVAVVAIIPVFFLSGYMVNPEAVLAPLWLLYLTLLDDLRLHREPWRPLLVGLVIGVAFLAKYTALLAVPVTVLFVAVSPAARAWLRRPSFYLAGVAALLITFPVVAWNYAHDWPSIRLHLVERMPPETAATFAHNAVRGIVGQLTLFHPLLFPGLLAAGAMTLLRARTDPRYRLLAVTSAPVLLFFYAVMTRVCDAEPHWTMVGYLPLAIAAGGWLDEMRDQRSRVAAWAFGYGRACAGVSIAAAVFAVAYVASPRILDLVPAASYDGNADLTSELFGWDHVENAIVAEARALGPDAVVVSHHNVLCGHLFTALGDQPAVYCASPRRTEFDFLGRRDPPKDVPVVFVESTRYPADPASVLPGRRCEPVRALDIERGARVLNQFRLYSCSPEETCASRGGECDDATTRESGRSR